MPATPLSHLRVLDLTDLRGALAGRLLADLGAEVVKLEPPGGDADRLRPPFAGGVAAKDRSLAFLYRHANKRGATLDLATVEGRARLAELCDGADVLIENLDLGRRAELALEPDAVSRRHPQLVHLAIADFGLSGPRAGWRLEALPAFAASGALHASGLPEMAPCWLPGYTAHDCASIFAVAGALAALGVRRRDGLGQRVEVSVQEAAIHGLVPWSLPLVDYARRHPKLAPQTSRNGNGSYHVLPTKDGWVRTVIGTPRQWQRFVALLGDPEAFAAPEWRSSGFRLANLDAIRLVASEILRVRSQGEVLAEARRLDVPLVPVHSPDAFVADEQTRVRGIFRRTAFPHLEGAPLCAAPFRFSTLAISLDRPAPACDTPYAPLPPRASVAPSRAAPGGSPLAGVRVVHLGVGAVVPELCGLLGELGAEVVKIESRANLDFLRRLSFERDQPNRSYAFNMECRGQKSVCLDLRTPRGRELALRLCATADVVAENNRGGVVAAWGLDYEDLRRLRPDIVYVSSQAYGRGGPLGQAPGFGPLNCAFAGQSVLWNHPDAPLPTASSLNHPDHVAGKLGAVAVLAALDHRWRTGEGQFIDMAQTEAAAYLAGESYLEGPTTGREARAAGNAVAYACPHGVYPCAGEDRWVAIAVVGDEGWAAFRRVTGWEDAPALRTLGGRLAARPELDERIAAWTRSRAAEEVAEALQASGVSAMAAMDPEDLRSDAHLAARGGLVTVLHPETGAERHVANPLRLTRTPVRHAGAAPRLGEHGEAVLRDWLGIDADEIARLVAEGVCR
ncbi:MAG TPA: CoA transferase [Myxococcota bacterium]|nr:CoA transferase [Myxococcota bacterium]